MQPSNYTEVKRLSAYALTPSGLPLQSLPYLNCSLHRYSGTVNSKQAYPIQNDIVIFHKFQQGQGLEETRLSIKKPLSERRNTFKETVHLSIINQKSTNNTIKTNETETTTKEISGDPKSPSQLQISIMLLYLDALTGISNIGSTLVM